MSFVRKDDFLVKILIFNQALSIGRTENASDGHTASYRGFYSKFFSKKCVKCSSFENDDELMLMVVQAHSEQQQQCFRLTLLNKHVNELLYPRIQFAEFTSQIDSQTALKAFLFQIFHVNFLQFGLKTHHFGSKFSIFPNFIQAYSAKLNF